MKKSHKLSIISAIALVYLASSLVAVIPTKTSALSGSDFKAGRIIDNAVFYNKNSMSVNQIQTFLNAKVPSCDRWRSSSNPTYQPPWTCLKEYQENTTTKENNIGKFNSNGTPKSVSGGKSAARIIWEVAQQYGLNPQVLIVMLQKEQSLITDNWPWKIQYDRAMGYACPDSGPGYTANCDSNYYGFYNQVDAAAWQLKRYIQLPDNYNFKARVTRYIQYSPNPSCSGSNVFIENEATAALYNYTPYQPNAGALANLYGTANCGSYGNRNFWRLFNDWFGSTRYIVRGAIATKYTNYGGLGALGLPQMNEWCNLPQNGCYQVFENGSIYWTKDTGAWVVRAGMRTSWGSVESVNGFLGYPVDDERSINGGAYQEFQGGNIFWSPETGTNIIHGGINKRFIELNETEGYLGFPLGGEVKINGGVFQQFEGGRIYWSQKSGAWNTRGGIQNKYTAMGTSTSPLGFPTSDEIIINGGVFQQFEGGRIYWANTIGAHPVYGAIGARYSSINNHLDSLGYPTETEQKSDDGAYQIFEKGRIFWSEESGAWQVSGDLLAEYMSLGGATSSLGYPNSSQLTLDDGFYQSFEGGRIYLKNGENSHIVRGAVLMRYRINGGHPSLGYPLGQETSVSKGVSQQFEKGTIYWSDTTGARIIKSSILSKYKSSGEATSILGFPINSEKSYINGSYQEFENGRIYHSENTGAHILRGGILGKYLSSYTDQIKLGLPTSEEAPHPTNGIYQSFEGGEVFWNDFATLNYY